MTTQSPALGHPSQGKCVKCLANSTAASLRALLLLLTLGPSWLTEKPLPLNQASTSIPSKAVLTMDLLNTRPSRHHQI